MKLYQDFIAHTHLSGNRIKISILLIALGLLYSGSYQLLETVLLNFENPIFFFFMLFLWNIFCVWIVDCLLFFFLRLKREDSKTRSYKTMLIPAFTTQAILAGSVILLTYVASYAQLMSFEQPSFVYLNILLSAILLCLWMIYIPLQICCAYQIYDGERNPFRNLKSAISKIRAHYQSIFYSFICVFMIVLLYRFLMTLCFDGATFFLPTTMMLDLMNHIAPFDQVFYYGRDMMTATNLIAPTIVSFLYGCLIIYAMLHFYMFMAVIYDEEIKI